METKALVPYFIRSPFQMVSFPFSNPPMPSMPAPFQSYKREIVYGTICISPANRILLVKGRTHQKWSFPKGHLERGEGSFRCALRELYEETGIRIDADSVNPCNVPYKKFKTANYFVLDLAEESKPVPQDQDEICDARWMDVDEVLRIATSTEANIDVRLFVRLMSAP